MLSEKEQSLGTKKRNAKAKIIKLEPHDFKAAAKNALVSRGKVNTSTMAQKKKRVSWAEKLENFQDEVGVCKQKTIDSVVNDSAVLTPRKPAIKIKKNEIVNEVQLSKNTNAAITNVAVLNKEKSANLVKFKSKAEQKTAAKIVTDDEANTIVDTTINMTSTQQLTEAQADTIVDILEDAEFSKDLLDNSGIENDDNPDESLVQIIESRDVQPIKSAGKIFVGNVSYNVKSNSLKKLFTSYGQIEAIYKRSLLQKTEKLTKKMFGTDKELKDIAAEAHFYVRFANAESARSSTALNGVLFKDRNLRVTLSCDKSTNPDRTLFVGNLPYQISEQRLLELFAKKVGDVEFVRVVHDKKTGLGKGYGFVMFKHANNISKALEEMKGQRIDGRVLRLTKLQKDRSSVFAATKHQTRDRKKAHEDNSLRKKLENYTVTKATFAKLDIDGVAHKLSKTAIKSIKKRKQLKLKKRSLLS